MAEITILYLGATGYLGGSVLMELLRSNLAQSTALHLYILSRTSANLDKLKKHLSSSFNEEMERHTFDYLEIDHSQLDKIRDLAGKSDVIMNPADSDDLDLTNALNTGLSRNGSPSPSLKRGKPIHIHVSGTALLCDGINGARGPGEGEPIYNDLDAARVWDLPETALHHKIDLALLKAGTTGSIDTAMILPPVIHGIGTGFKKLTRQGPTLIRAAYERKCPGTVGKGLNYWSYCHVEDVSAAIVKITESAIKGEADVNKDGVYFITAKSLADKTTTESEVLRLGCGELRFKEYLEAIAQHIEFYKPSHLDSLTPTVFTEEEEDKYLGRPDGAPVFGGNSLSTAERTRQLGWSPKANRPDVYGTLKEEVHQTLQEMNVL